jgi:hypothetical protein
MIEKKSNAVDIPWSPVDRPSTQKTKTANEMVAPAIPKVTLPRFDMRNRVIKKTATKRNDALECAPN